MKRRATYFFLIFTVVLIAIFVVPSKLSDKSSSLVINWTKPALASSVSFAHRLAGIFSVFGQIGNLRKDNQRLEEEAIALRVDQARLSELEIENKDLQNQLAFKNAHPEMNLLLANVIGLDPTNFYDTLVLDKGERDGVKNGMAVVSFGTLVGKIDQVSDGSSRIVLVTSRDSIIQVMLQNSRTAGILKGGISGMVLDDIPLDTTIDDNENIITSGLGGGLPKGIYVGNAGSLISAKSDIFKAIEIKSPINFSKLERLYIVIGG